MLGRVFKSYQTGAQMQCPCAKNDKRWFREIKFFPKISLIKYEWVNRERRSKTGVSNSERS